MKLSFRGAFSQHTLSLTMATAAARRLLHRSTKPQNIRSFSTHEFLTRNSYVNSWAAPSSPKQAQAQLAHLRRAYAQKVKIVRKEYALEVETLRLDKARKDEAKREATRIANQERRAAKDASRMQRAAQRQLADQEFRQTLLKERAAKLEYWKKKLEQVEEKKKKAKEDVRRRSSMWVEEAEMEKKIFESVVDVTQL